MSKLNTKRGELKDCIMSNQHLTDCDDDGFCNHCGYQDNIRDMLEEQILEDANNGDTTVLYSLLEILDNQTIFNALSDKNQEEINSL